MWPLEWSSLLRVKRHGRWGPGDAASGAPLRMGCQGCHAGLLQPCSGPTPASPAACPLPPTAGPATTACVCWLSPRLSRGSTGAAYSEATATARAACGRPTRCQVRAGGRAGGWQLQALVLAWGLVGRRCWYWALCSSTVHSAPRVPCRNGERCADGDRAALLDRSRGKHWPPPAARAGRSGEGELAD